MATLEEVKPKDFGDWVVEKIEEEESKMDSWLFIFFAFYIF